MAGRKTRKPRARRAKGETPSVAESAAPSYSPRRILLDTHTWIWWFTGDGRLGAHARALIAHAGDVRFSSASAWEIAIKHAIGKLVLHGDVDLAREIERDGFVALPVTLAHAEEVRRLPGVHRDPFDRMLVAQARVEGLTIVTGDELFQQYDTAIVDARR
jgi:PIN domain nuclease of toxin-antitoxin system